jgi:hypothetical protein
VVQIVQSRIIANPNPISGRDERMFKSADRLWNLLFHDPIEREWVVRASETKVSCTRPNGKVESLEWDDLKIVVIDTTDERPYAPDVFWHLAGE